MSMRVDIVTGPVRYRVLPLVGLLLVMMIPVAGLTALLVWSDREADAHEAAEDGGDDPTAPPAAVTPATPVLPTSMLSYRRVPGPVGSVAAGNRLSSSLDQLYAYVDDRSCAAVSVGDRTVSAYNASAPVIPASTHKLLVATVALDQLGAEHRFTTEVRGVTPVDGVVAGNLHLVGGGDPLLTSNDFPIQEDPQPAYNTTSLDALADAVVAAGVTTIDGAVVGDGDRYDDIWENPTWGPGVAGVEAGPYDALLVNDARVLGRPGRERDPNLAAAREFSRLLGARGVVVRNGWDAGATPGELGVLASVQSEPLSAIVEEMLVTSDDDTAEMLLKELGVADSGTGTIAAGLNVVDRTLRTWGLPMDNVRLVDASGLSPENRLTCRFLVALLGRVVEQGLVGSLPVAARTGTLATEFVGSEVDGRLAAKTGSLGNPPEGFDPPAVKALAGILESPDGPPIRFALVLNADGANDPEVYRSYWDALQIRLAAHPTGPDRSALGPR